MPPAVPPLARLTPTLALLLAGCAVGAVDAEASIVDLHPLDIEETGVGKADGATYAPNRIISDDAFADVHAMDADDVQRFFEETPYGNRSFLADEYVNGERMSHALVRVAQTALLNPLVLLATLQKEAGLVSKSAAPSRFRVDYAFGCGCPDGRNCSQVTRGLDKQLACAADALEHAFQAASRGEPTRSDLRLYEAFTTLDDVRVVPSNRATVALYTYTPWVGTASRSGNWLFHNVWLRYTTHVNYDAATIDRAAAAFIGSACDDDFDCGYAGGFCLAQNGGRFCSMRCDRFCPDRAGHPTTFCMDAFADGEGYCTTRCDVGDVTSCLPEQRCAARTRAGESSATQSVCTY